MKITAWGAAKGILDGKLEPLLEFLKAGNSIEAGSTLAGVLIDAIEGGADFRLKLVGKRPGQRGFFERKESSDRKVRIAWFIEARLQRGERFDAVLADAEKAFSVKRKSAEAYLTEFRRNWDQCECKPGEEPRPIEDPKLCDFLESWNDVLHRYPNG